MSENKNKTGASSNKKNEEVNPSSDNTKTGENATPQKPEELTLESLKELLGIDTQGLDVTGINHAIKTFVSGEGIEKVDTKGLTIEQANGVIAAHVEAEKAKSDATSSDEDLKKKEEEASKKRLERLQKDKEAAAKARKKVFKDDRGLKFKFSDNCPDRLNVDGRSMNLNEIIEEPDILLELTSGNSSFVEQIYS